MGLKEEVFELIRDQFTWGTTVVLAFLSIMLSRVNENPALLGLGLYVFLLIFIAFNSAHTLTAQKKRPGIIVGPHEERTEIHVPKYPTLHPFAIGGLVLSVLMLISAFFIPSFRSIVSPTSVETPTATITVVLNPEFPTATSTGTSTPLATATETSTPTSTPTETAIPLPTPFIKLDCFDSSIWTPYKHTDPPIFIRDDGCWELNPWGFTARDDGMIITPPIAPKGIGHGIYIPIKDITTIKLNIFVKKIDINYGNSSNIAIGIIDKSAPGLNTSRVVYYHYIPSTSLNNIAIKTGEDAEYKALLEPILRIGESQELILKVNGPLLTVFINQAEIVELVIPFKKKAFWISYSVPDYGELIATISNLEIK